MSNKKMIRVEMEFEDGEVVSLVDEEAEKWHKAINEQTTLCFAHGLQLPKLNFTKTHKEKK